jgi:hypothetical protein
VGPRVPARESRIGRQRLQSSTQLTPPEALSDKLLWQLELIGARQNLSPFLPAGSTPGDEWVRRIHAFRDGRLVSSLLEADEHFSSTLYLPLCFLLRQRMKPAFSANAQRPSRWTAMGLYRFQGYLETGRPSLPSNWPIYPRTLVSSHTDADQCRTVGKSRTPPVVLHSSFLPVLDTESCLFLSRLPETRNPEPPLPILDTNHTITATRPPISPSCD